MNTHSNTLNFQMDLSKAQQRPGSQAPETTRVSANPFTMNLNVKPFNVNVRSFKPSEFIPTMPLLTTRTQFTPSTASESSLGETLASSGSETAELGSTKRYKTELCKNWIESGLCRYGKKCQFAHGQDELESARAAAGMDEKLRTKNCRTFYKEKVCNYGSRCMFRHEHRHIRQIHRHYYVAKLCAYETLFQYSKDQEEFVTSYETGVPKLSAFREIHALDDGEEAESADFDGTISIENVEDDSMSFGEMEEEIIAFCDPDIKSPSDIEEQNHSLNTSIGSSHESERAESAWKNEDRNGTKGFNLAS